MHHEMKKYQSGTRWEEQFSAVMMPAATVHACITKPWSAVAQKQDSMRALFRGCFFKMVPLCVTVPQDLPVSPAWLTKPALCLLKTRVRGVLGLCVC